MLLLNGDNIKLLQDLEDNSVDSVVTDPPYGLSFMNKKWDHDVPSKYLWMQVKRVLKPGGHLLSFGGTRTYHRMACAIEDAGFEIRDQIMWLYGSGFPKSHNISKAIDKKFGAERDVIGISENTRDRSGHKVNAMNRIPNKPIDITEPATDLAKQWDGFGTALKPANEPIVLARKPLSEKTIVDNVLKWGTGGLNIDGCRVPIDPNDKNSRPNGSIPLSEGGKTSMFKQGGRNYESNGGNTLNMSQGRFPANVILDEEAGKVLDEQSIAGGIHSAGKAREKSVNSDYKASSYDMSGDRQMNRFDDDGKIGASRFFYCAKASKKERGPENVHPTVKPIKLMEYLIKLVTPPGGTVLDPYMGSGSTGIAAKNLGFDFIGMELDEEYFEIASNRIN